MTPHPEMTIAGFSEQGPRDYNEDRYLTSYLDLNGAQHTLMAVADGLGGEGHGHLAAEICKNELAKAHFDLATSFAGYCNHKSPTETDQKEKTRTRKVT